MTIDILKKYFSEYFRKCQVKIDVTGFDMEAFSKTVNQELADQLNAIEYIAFEDEDVMSPDEKIESIQALFQHDFSE